jgi:hypothetical protein
MKYAWFQASASKKMKSASFWNITQPILTEVSGQLISPILKSQGIQEENFLAGYRDPWRGTDRMYRNFSNELQLYTT